MNAAHRYMKKKSGGRNVMNPVESGVEHMHTRISLTRKTEHDIDCL